MNHVDLTNAFEEGTTRADYIPVSDWKALGIFASLALPYAIAMFAVFN